ncbi:MAG: hypothetical protein GNW80_15540 [Asgard group archaeon]|nr:hypothetical protein [Asgard group archaeon]
MENTTSTNNRGEYSNLKVDVTKRNHRNREGYSKYEFVIIGLTALILILGFLLRTWRIIREGMPIAFDGYKFQKIAKGIFFEGWSDFSGLTRDLPGIFLILVIAEHLLGLPGQPIMWSIFIFPQIVCTLQLIIFYILAKRLTKSRMISLISMFCMTFLGLIVYRNQNVAPETFVLGLVPFVVFFIGRYFETNDFRFIFVGLFITGGILLIHHLTTLIVLVLWHILIFYEFIYKKIKKKTYTKRMYLINTSILIVLDILVVIFWQFALKGYPFDFVKNSTQNLFEGGNLVAIILTILGVVLLNTITFSIFFYNFDKKKINTGIIVSIILVALIIFGMAVFFGGSVPDLTLITILVIGTPAFVLPPLAALGVTKIPKINESMSRTSRGWLFTVVLILSITAIFPIMTSLLARLALYIVPIVVVLAAIGIIYLVKKVKMNKLKAVILLCLIGTMTTTMSFAYPAPENNFGQQEIYREAEFCTIDFLVLYRYQPNNTVFYPYPANQVLVDSDFRISLIIEGYSGIDATYSTKSSSWLIQVFILRLQNYSYFVATSSPKLVDNRIDYIYVSRVMFVDGFHSGWADYGSEKDNWIIKLPDISTSIPMNPHISRIYDTNLTYLLLPIYSFKCVEKNE